MGPPPASGTETEPPQGPPRWNPGRGPCPEVRTMWTPRGSALLPSGALPARPLDDRPRARGGRTMSAGTARDTENATADTGWFDELEDSWTQDGWDGLDASTAQGQARPPRPTGPAPAR